MGLDIGTSVCKAAVFDAKGRLQALARRTYALNVNPDGKAELDSTDVIKACRESIAEAARGRAENIRALAISSQGEAFTPMDANGRALCPAMVSSDTRASCYVAMELPDLDHSGLYQITGHTPHPMFTLYKMLWLRDNRPAIWQSAVKFLCFEDLLHREFGLDPAISWPLAGRTMMFDVRRHDWSVPILNFLGLTPDKLSRPLQSGSIVGALTDNIAASWGLPSGVLVVAGGHDQPCSALGAGAITPGSAMYATGTVDCITPAFTEPVFSADLMRANLCTYDHAAPGLYATIAVNLTGGNALQWFHDEFGHSERANANAGGRDAYELLLETAAASSSSLLALPYLASAGTPYFDTTTPGAILGLRLTTKRGDILRSLLEGLALEMRLNLEILAKAGVLVENLRAVGGGARSDWWNQLKADVLSHPVVVPDVTEAGCLGAAMLACAAHTGADVTTMAKSWVRPRKEYMPQRDAASFYTERFAAYCNLYPTLRDFTRRQTLNQKSNRSPPLK
jgi:xylulokinase